MSRQDEKQLKITAESPDLGSGYRSISVRDNSIGVSTIQSIFDPIKVSFSKKLEVTKTITTFTKVHKYEDIDLYRKQSLNIFAYIPGIVQLGLKSGWQTKISLTNNRLNFIYTWLHIDHLKELNITKEMISTIKQKAAGLNRYDFYQRYGDSMVTKQVMGKALKIIFFREYISEKDAVSAKVELELKLQQKNILFGEGAEYKNIYRELSSSFKIEMDLQIENYGKIKSSFTDYENLIQYIKQLQDAEPVVLSWVTTPYNAYLTDFRHSALDDIVRLGTKYLNETNLFVQRLAQYRESLSSYTLDLQKITQHLSGELFEANRFYQSCVSTFIKAVDRLQNEIDSYQENIESYLDDTKDKIILSRQLQQKTKELSTKFTQLINYYKKLTDAYQHFKMGMKSITITIDENSVPQKHTIQLHIPLHTIAILWEAKEVLTNNPITCQINEKRKFPLLDRSVYPIHDGYTIAEKRKSKNLYVSFRPQQKMRLKKVMVNAYAIAPMTLIHLLNDFPKQADLILSHQHPRLVTDSKHTSSIFGFMDACGGSCGFEIFHKENKQINRKSAVSILIAASKMDNIRRMVALEIFSFLMQNTSKFLLPPIKESKVHKKWDKVHLKLQQLQAKLDKIINEIRSTYKISKVRVNELLHYLEDNQLPEYEILKNIWEDFKAYKDKALKFCEEHDTFLTYIKRYEKDIELPILDNLDLYGKSTYQANSVLDALAFLTNTSIKIWKRENLQSKVVHEYVPDLHSPSFSKKLHIRLDQTDHSQHIHLSKTSPEQEEGLSHEIDHQHPVRSTSLSDEITQGSHEFHLSTENFSKQGLNMVEPMYRNQNDSFFNCILACLPERKTREITVIRDQIAEQLKTNRIRYQPLFLKQKQDFKNFDDLIDSFEGGNNLQEHGVIKQAIADRYRLYIEIINSDPKIAIEVINGVGSDPQQITYIGRTGNCYCKLERAQRDPAQERYEELLAVAQHEARVSIPGFIDEHTTMSGFDLDQSDSELLEHKHQSAPKALGESDSLREELEVLQKAEQELQARLQSAQKDKKPTRVLYRQLSSMQTQIEVLSAHSREKTKQASHSAVLDHASSVASSSLFHHKVTALRPATSAGHTTRNQSLKIGSRTDLPISTRQSVSSHIKFS